LLWWISRVQLQYFPSWTTNFMNTIVHLLTSAYN
jgi:hypothetical protein